jgi:polysaccharide biosynthesis/export protein
MKMKKKTSGETGLSISGSIYLLFIVFLSLFAAGCSASKMTHDQAKDILSGNLKDKTADPQSPLYTIQPGDIIRINIAEYSEFDTTVTVSPSGYILLKLIGELQVRGLTASQLTNQLILKLSEFVVTEVHPVVIVENPFIQKVAVLGAVAKQDNYNIPNDMSLLQILALAGGPSPEADVQHIKIIQGGDPNNIVEVDLTQFLERGKSQVVPTIKASDIIFVPKEENIVRELSSFFRDAIFIFSFFVVSR